MSGQLGTGWTLGRCVAVAVALVLLVVVVGSMVAASSGVDPTELSPVTVGPAVPFTNEEEVP